MIKTLVIALLFASGCSSAKKQTVTPIATDATPVAVPEKVTTPLWSAVLSCSKNQETRTVQVVANGEGCKLEYTKHHHTTSPTRSSHGTKSCVAAKAKLRTRLEKSGYECSE